MRLGSGEVSLAVGTSCVNKWGVCGHALAESSVLRLNEGYYRCMDIHLESANMGYLSVISVGTAVGRRREHTAFTILFASATTAVGGRGGRCRKSGEFTHDLARQSTGLFVPAVHEWSRKDDDRAVFRLTVLTSLVIQMEGSCRLGLPTPLQLVPNRLSYTPIFGESPTSTVEVPGDVSDVSTEFTLAMAACCGAVC
jgi:hypothetical protein